MEKKSLFEDLLGFDEPVNLEEPVEKEVIEDTSEEQPKEDVAEDVVEEEVDDRVKVLYDILVDSNIIPEDEEFQPTIENFETLVADLPEQMFAQAVSTLPDFAQELLQLSFQKPDLTIQDFAEFFDTYYLRPNSVEQPTTDDEAYEFLKPLIMQTKLFTSEEKATRYLDDLLQDGLLLEKAQEVYQEQYQAIQQEKQEQLELVRQQKLQEEQQRVQFYEQLYDTVQSLDWDKSRKQAVLENLKPDEAMRKNDLISKSPKALAQLADIYSYFDEAKGEFDFSELGIRKVSQQVKAAKDNIERDKISSHLSKIKTNPKDPGGSFWSSFKQTN